ncbi:TetR/AcrR family transcriptional regulator [Virgisporangium ochraceum]|uniref:TetR family transcriptional regulator n=1 Tax=Virgisporangium ochraceum TaxID=65505 RepID=A0A8J4EEJ5_9ACTN|nr:TetR/AcrR family transcriptional regulator [Virgisporangium ochraceum]GIJ71801.1 TetR family transcriptional regulator [Virgisporangium ochraceum]
MSGQRQGRRAYDSTGRRAQAEATRLRILDTARRLFVEHGYAGTSMAQIAAAAGVSVPTVFSAYRSKVNVLRTAAETTIVGDADQVPLHERPAMRHVHDGATAAEVLDRLADLNAATAERAYPIFAVVNAAADAEPEIAELVRVIDGQRLAGATMLARTVVDRLGDDDPARFTEIRDSIWALNSLAMYGLLVAERGWPLDRYREWVRRALHAVVLP